MKKKWPVNLCKRRTKPGPGSGPISGDYVAGDKFTGDKVMGDKHVDTPASLLLSLVEGGATLVACQMSMDVMGIRAEELIGGVDLGGVAAFLAEAQESGTTLFI